MKCINACPVLLLMLLLVGCGPGTVPVSGKVSFDGVPGENISVLFQGKQTGGVVPEAAFGMTNKAGEYSLSLIQSKKRGAVPGDYVVYFSWIDPKADPSPMEGVTVANPCPYVIPEDAGNGQTTFTVPANGTKEADFNFNRNSTR